MLIKREEEEEEENTKEGNAPDSKRRKIAKKKTDEASAHDFLASIEVLIVERASQFLSENWIEKWNFIDIILKY